MLQSCSPTINPGIATITPLETHIQEAEYLMMQVTHQIQPLLPSRKVTWTKKQGIT